MKREIRDLTGRPRWRRGLTIASTWLLATAASAEVVFLDPTAESLAPKAGETASFERREGAISILRFDGDYDRGMPDFNAAPRRAVAEAFYGEHADSLDFLVVFTTFDFDLGGARAFYVGIQNDTEGLGLEPFDASNSFGSGDGRPGRLQGYVDMGRLDSYELDPRRPEYDELLGTLGHEIGHRWCCYVELDHPELPADALLGLDGSHWSDLYSSGASLLYGHDWEDLGSGTFHSRAIRSFYGPLDLYLAGFLTPTQVGDQLLIENPSLDPAVLPEQREEVTGVARSISLDDVVRAVGPRVPNAAESRRTHRAGFILLARTEDFISPEILAALERVRLDFAERFAALTGGVARLELSPENHPEHEPGEPTGGPGGGDLLEGPVNVSLALAWLRSRQESEGSWSDTPGTRLRDTHEVLRALVALDTTFTGLPSALSWLGDRDVASIDDQARQLAALGEAGLEAPETLAALLSAQREDGGWGAGRRHGSDPLDTALALLALDGRGPPVVIERGFAALLSHESPEGGWPSVRDGAARASTTAVVLELLHRAGRLAEPAVGRALAFLANAQNDDGGFGDSPSSTHGTARVISALVALEAAGLSAPTQLDRAAAETFLAGRQTVDGSWDGSVFATSLAVRALEQGRLPNLVAGPLTIEPTSPRDGERVRITLPITNGGGSPAAVELQLFDGEPGAGGLSFADVSLGGLASGEHRRVDVVWDTLDLAGPHRLVAVLDPNGTIVESDETDNTAALDVTVEAVPSGIELEVGSPDLVIDPMAPDHLPADLAFFLGVRNLGVEDASDVLVRLWEGEPGLGTLLLETRINIPSRSTTPLQAMHLLTAPGATDFTLEVDPEQAIPEEDEENNVARATVTTTPSLDLAVGAIEITGSRQVGADLAVTVPVSNRGTLDLERNVALVLSIDSGAGPIEVGRRSIFLVAGETQDISFTWRAEAEGEVTLTASLDLSGTPVILDVDPSNDAASRALTIGANTLPNLHVGTVGVTLEPAVALEGSPLVVRTEIENTGAAVGPFTATLWDGPPADGLRVGEIATFPGLEALGSVEVAFTWPSIPGDQDRLLTLVVATDVPTAEISADDNTLLIDLPVLSLPDPAVSAAGLRLEPAFPRPNEPVTLLATVTNLGEQPASNLLVRTLDSAAETTLPVLEAGAEIVVPLAIASGEAGEQTAGVVLDPDDSILERSEANNRAEITFSVGDGAVAAEPRWISPDGDGVQDVARVTVRSNRPEIVARIVDGTGEVVRTLELEAPDGELRAEWDGRNDRGRLVRDGAYRIEVEAQGESVGAAQIIVDTNRAPLLDALSTDLLDERCLTCGLPRLAEPPVVTADEAWIFFRLTAPEEGFAAGVYRVATDGSEVEALFTVSGRLRVTDFEVAPLGDVFYVEVSDALVPENGFRELRGLDGYAFDLGEAGLGFDGFDATGERFFDQVGGELRYSETRDPEGAPEVVLADGDLTTLSPDRRTLLDTEAQGTRWWTVDALTGARLELPGIRALEALEDPVWSWDSTKIAFRLRFLGVVEGEEPPPDEIAIYARSGSLLARFQVPQDAIEAALAGRVLDPSATAEARLRDVQWDGGGERLALRLVWDDLADSGQAGTRFSVVEADSGAVISNFWSEPGDRVDAGLGAAAPVKMEEDEEEPLEPYFGASRQLFVPNNESLLLYRGRGPATAAYLAGGRRSFAEDEGRTEFQTLASGHLVHLERPDPDRPTDADWWQIRTLANLTADLRLRRSADARVVILEGTAADANFAAYQLDYAPLSDPEDWRPIAPLSSRQVVDEIFLPWVAPAEDTWRVRLTVTDRAGNRRSVVRRVSTQVPAGVVDVFPDVELFSPNADGVLDTVTLHYRTLGPWQADFQVKDAAGRVLLGRSRTHLAAESASFTWDGRDARGQAVADGVYQLELEGFAFTVVVDTKAPEVSLELYEPYSRVTASLSTQPELATAVLKSSAQEQVSARLEVTRLDTNDWRFYDDAFSGSPDNPRLLTNTLRPPFAEALGSLYRVVAEDAAGNRAVLATAPVPEKLTLTLAGDHRVAADGSLLPLVLPLTQEALDRLRLEILFAQPEGRAPAPIPVLSTLIRFHALETIRQPLASLALEVREADGAWVPLGIEGFLEPDGTLLAGPTEHFVRFAREMGDVPNLRRHELRLRAVDVTGTEFRSQSVTLNPPGGCAPLTFHGVLDGSLGLDPDCYDPAEISAAVEDMTAELGVDPERQTVLWATETLDVDIDEIALFLRSDSDPSYAVPVLLRPAAVRDGAMLFLADLECASYAASLEVVTEPVETDVGIRPLTFQVAANVNHAERCLSLGAEALTHVAQSCDAPAPGRFTVELTAHGQGLEVLRLEDGEGRTVWSEVAPTEALLYRVELDIDDLQLADGLHRFRASVTNADGQTRSREIVLPVDRTPPSLSLEMPTPGATVCAQTTPGGDPFMLFELSSVDAFPGAGQLAGEVPGTWPEGSNLGPLGYSVFRNGEAFGEFLSLSAEADAFVANQPIVASLRRVPGAASVTASVEVVGIGGHRVCEERSFVVDALADEARIDGPVIFSPNGDGVLDVGDLGLLPVAEALTVDIHIEAGVLTEENGDRRCESQEGAEIVAQVAGGLALPGVASVGWDGRRDGGGMATAGCYRAISTARDACGLISRSSSLVVIDTTPPSLTLEHPVSGPIEASFLDIRWTTSDDFAFVRGTDLPAVTVELSYGLGAAPSEWFPLPEPLWNTANLPPGDYTLRAIARDRAGNATERRAVLQLDPRDLFTYFEPAPTLFSPNGDDRFETTTARFGTSRPARVELEVVQAGGLIRTLEASELPRGSFLVPWDGLDEGGALAPDGVYDLSLRGYEIGSDVIAQEESLPVTLDATAPAWSVSRPVMDGFLRASDVLEASVVDLHLEQWIVSLAPATGGPPIWEEIARGIDQALSVPITLAEGPYLLRFEATDLAGTRSELRVPFEVDVTPPVAEWLTPAPGAVLGPMDVPVTLSGLALDENLDTVRLTAVDADGTVHPLASPTPNGEGVFSAAWDLGGLPDGPSTLVLTVTDRAGLETEVRRLITIDATAPAVSLADPSTGEFVTGPLDVVGTAEDPHLSFFEVQLAAAGSGAWSTLGLGIESVTSGVLWPWQNLPADGTYDLRLVAEDVAGNRGEFLVPGVRIDTEPPLPPQGLTVTVQGEGASLGWHASPSADVVTYRIFRDGVLRLETPALSWADTPLGEGRFIYTVVAVDRAGQESEPSEPAEISLDRTPPQVAIFSPTNGDVVSGVVDVRGTAFAADLFTYRLEAIAEGGGSTLTLRESPLPVQVDILGSFDTTSLAEGSMWTLRLSAEDTSGNEAATEITVTVDNQPPAAPTSLDAMLSAADEATVSWQAPADSDVRGYLLYRDGRLANADGPVIGDLDPFLLEGTSFVDSGLPDGTFTYVAYAMDEAGNLSPPSNEDTVTVETGAPRVVILSPEDGTRFDQPLTVVAGSEDEDLDTVRLEYRPTGGAWTELGTAGDPPWEAFLDPLALVLSEGNVELRAIGTDHNGNVDPAPAAITVTFTDVTPPVRALGLVARVDGGDVTLTWQGDSVDPDPVGYHVERLDGQAWTRLTGAPQSATSFVDAGRLDGEWTYSILAVDSAGNEAERSEAVVAQVYTPDLLAPFSPTTQTDTTLSGIVAPDAIVTAAVTAPSGPSERQETSDAEGAFTLVLSLERGQQLVTVTAEDADGNRSKPAQVQVISAERPDQPQNLEDGGLLDEVALTWDAVPGDLLGYRVFQNGEPVLPDAAVPVIAVPAVIDEEPGTFWQGDAGDVLEIDLGGDRLVSTVELTWRTAVVDGTETVRTAGSLRLQALHGPAWVTLAELADDLRPVATLSLADPYPASRLRLVVDGLRTQGGLDQPAQLSEIRVTETRLATTDPSWTASVPPGRYVFEVSAIHRHGFESLRSQPTPEREIGDVTPPDPPVLSGLVNGADAELSWTGPADAVSYQLSRDDVVIANPASSSFTDLALPNGTYRYVVQALDEVGNLSTPSNEVVLEIDQPAPSAPVWVSFEVFSSSVLLEWTPGAGPAPDSYGVWRATQPGGPYTEIARTGGNAHFDSFEDGPPAQALYYVIVVYDAAGNVSAPTEERVARFAAPEGSPELFYPVPSARPYSAAENRQTIVGYAEPGASVELRLGGTPVATASAASTTLSERLSAGCPGTLERPWASSDGRFLWVDCGASHQLVDFESSTVEAKDLFGTGTARWIPYRHEVLFTTETGEVHRHDVVTGAGEQLTSGSIRLALPLVTEASPTGLDRLLLLAESDGIQGLWDYEIAAGTQTLLVAMGTGYEEVLTESLNLSSDGRHATWIRDGEVELLERATGEVRTLTVFADPEAMPHFAWDGGSLMFFEAIEFGSFAGPTAGLLSMAERAGLLKFLVRVASRHDLATGSSERLGFFQTRARLAPYEGWAAAIISGEGLILSLSTLDGNREEWLDFFFVSREEERVRPWFSPSGHIFLVIDGEAIRYTPEGRFEVPDQALLDGENVFTAVADGLSSETVTIRFGDEPGEQPEPDLNLDLLVVPSTPLAGDTVRVTAILRNLSSDGDAPASDLSVAVQGPDGFVQDLALFDAVEPLAALATRLHTFDLTVPTPGLYTIVGSVDTADQVQESDESNNAAQITLRALDPSGGPTVEVTTDRPVYGSQETVTVTALVVHSGLDPWEGELRLSIEDAAGFEVTELLTEPLMLGFGEEASLSADWSTGDLFAGGYQVRARLVSSGAEAAPEAAADFEIAPEMEIVSILTPDASSYAPGATAVLEARVDYAAGNVLLNGAQASIVVSDPTATEVGRIDQTLGAVLPGQDLAVGLLWPVPLGASGLHTGRFELRTASGQLLTQAEATFLISEAPVVLAGSLSAITPAPAGPDLSVTWSVSQTGGPVLAALPLRLELRSATSGDLVDGRDITATLVGATASAAESLSTIGAGPGPHLLTLEAILPEGVVTLAAVPITLVDETPPQLTFLRPTDAALVGLDGRIEVSASDALSPIARVEIRLDGGAWRRMDEAPTPGRYRSDLDALADDLQDDDYGLEARAVDAAGLETAEAIQITLDRTAPVIRIEGVIEDGVYLEPVSPEVTIEEAHPGTSNVLLNSLPYGLLAIEPSGEFTLAVSAVDLAGNAAQSTIRFTVADLSGSLITPSSVPAGDAIAVDWSLSESATLTLPPLPVRWLLRRLVDDEVVAEQAAEVMVEAGEVSGQLALMPADVQLGVHRLTFWVTTAAGERLLAETEVTFIDTTPPELTVLRPASGALVGVDGSVEATAADTLSAIAAVELRIDNGPWQPMTAATGNRFLGDLGDVADDLHTLTVRATDGAGLTAEEGHSFTVDRTPPILRVEGVEDGGAYAEPVVPVIVQEDAHPDLLTITLDGEPFLSGEVVDTAGEHLLVIEAIDAAGNRADRQLSFTVTLDAVAPRVESVTTAAQVIADCDTLQSRITVLEVEFSEPMPQAATTTAEGPFHLLAPGPNRFFETDACSEPLGDDVAIPLEASRLAPGRIQLSTQLLRDDAYRLRICGDLEDEAGNPLDGNGDGVGGDDHLLAFRVDRLNLFENGHFDCTLAGWQIAPPDSLQVSQSAEDFEEAPHSGSLRLAFAKDGERFTLGQCLAVEPSQSPYRWHSPMRLDGADGTQASVVRVCEAYDAPLCAGAPLGLWQEPLLLIPTDGIFIDRPDSPLITLPGTAMSARCELRVRSFDDGFFDVYLDGVTFGPAEIPSFFDGFESGNLSAWSFSSGTP